ncbi:hypothetical protein AB0N92_25015 [Streptomyces sp. NPDC093248]|uniref:hypothetical protein n=1 Tax=Streptomyces sp. NPDC093248 TaxID=3155072 RepID=UPI003425A7DE
MEAEEAERVVRTVHKAAARAVDRTESEVASGKARGADAKRAALTAIWNEFEASLESVRAACTEMVSPDYVHPYIELVRLQFALGELLEMRSAPHGMPTYQLLYSGKVHLDIIVADLDKRRDDARPIGARPSAGPGFYGDSDSRERRPHEGAQARAEAVGGEQSDVTTRPGLNSAHADSVPEVSAPYDDLREPWYRRLLGRNRGRQ